MARGAAMLGTLAVLSLLTSGCGGSGGGGSSGVRTLSCSFATEAYCSQITGPFTSAQESELSAFCSTAQGTYTAGPCSTANRLPGHCSYTGAELGLADAFQGRDYYDAGTWTLDAAKADCANYNGSWVN